MIYFGMKKLNKYVYYFGSKLVEGGKEDKIILGGKGSNLAEMTKMGIPVPPGFTISTEVCEKYWNKKNKNPHLTSPLTGRGTNYPKGLEEEIKKNLNRLEKEMGMRLGDKKNPLLVSVRSGAAVSMPGMMDTVLNLGLNDETVLGLIEKTGNQRFGWDAYRRFLQMFGDVVLEIKHEKFEKALEEVKRRVGVEKDTDLGIDNLKLVVSEYKKVYKLEGKQFPVDTKKQLEMAVEAVFRSWNSDRAIAYRRMNKITGLLGTAVTVQTMVFGNMGESSGTGVAFSRNPSTGENKFYGEYLMNAQGEDVVAGIRTPKSIDELRKDNPKIYSQLLAIRNKLEKHYKDMQDIEFTIQEERLFMLQARSGKRTAQAAVRMAVEMVEEKLIIKKEAVLRIEPNSLDQLLHDRLDEGAKKKAKLLTRGLPASPGAAVGKVVFSAQEAVEYKARGEKVILVRLETSPEDIEGMDAAEGVLTARGGMTSHAAVVARGMGKCCVSGCGELKIDYENQMFSIGTGGAIHESPVREGDYISLDGSTGEVFLGKIDLMPAELSGEFGVLMKWVDAYRKIGVRANADIPRDAIQAVKFGAEGIGLCRTEHMFFEGERIKYMRQMILADNLTDREKALERLIRYQRDDFLGLFLAMETKPVIIRLLDPPLHEFLPKTEAEIEELAGEMGISIKKIKERSESLHEFNPMLGHRGCRLGISYPEITRMQTRAIVEAAIKASKKMGKKAHPKIMVPLVGHVAELIDQKRVIEEEIEKVFIEQKMRIKVPIGTMIEVPRGALTADEVAREAEFFSFGTNDLTQMTCGFSRDDAGSFLGEYVEKGIYSSDPFESIDQGGVGMLMEIAIQKGRKVKPKLELGICGEHGGEPKSVEFCAKIGLDYVSCSPYRVPIARLAGAQAALRE